MLSSCDEQRAVAEFHAPALAFSGPLVGVCEAATRNLLHLVLVRRGRVEASELAHAKARIDDDRRASTRTPQRRDRRPTRDAVVIVGDNCRLRLLERRADIRRKLSEYLLVLEHIIFVVEPHDLLPRR